MAKRKYKEKKDRKILKEKIIQEKEKEKEKEKNILRSKSILDLFIYIYFSIISNLNNFIKNGKTYESFVENIDYFFKDRIKFKSRLISLAILMFISIIISVEMTNWILEKSGNVNALENMEYKLPDNLIFYFIFFMKNASDFLPIIFEDLTKRNTSNLSILLLIITVFISFITYYYIYRIFKGNYKFSSKKNIILIVIFNIIVILFLKYTSVYNSKLYILYLSLFIAYFYIFIMSKVFNELLVFYIFINIVYLFQIRIWFMEYTNEDISFIMTIALIGLFTSSISLYFQEKLPNILIMIIVPLIFLNNQSNIFLYLICGLLSIYLLGDILIWASLKFTKKIRHIFLKIKNDVLFIILSNNYKRYKKIKKIMLYITLSISLFFILSTVYTGVEKIFKKPTLCYINNKHIIINSPSFKKEDCNELFNFKIL